MIMKKKMIDRKIDYIKKNKYINRKIDIIIEKEKKKNKVRYNISIITLNLILFLISKNIILKYIYQNYLIYLNLYLPVGNSNR